MKHYLVDTFVYRGPRPRSVDELYEVGFKRCIILQSGIFELFSNDLYEQQFHNDYGIQVYPIKCSDIWPPSRWAVQTFLCRAQQAQAAQEKLFLHCMSGVDRTGFMSAVYNMQILGWSYERAYEDWVARGRHWWYDWWKYELKRYEVKRCLSK